MEKMIQLIAAWLGSLGFALLFNIRGRKLIYASLGGLLSWAVYLAVEYFNPNPYFCGFCATVAITLFAEIMAIVQKTPVTVFLVSAAIPLIPGAGLYRAMDCVMHGDWTGAASNGSYALLFAASMSAGITVTTIVFNLLRGFLQKHVHR